MKLFIFLSAAMFAASCSNSQKLSDTDVPVAVKSALQKSFPDAKEIKWEKEELNYEANFDSGEADYSLLIDSTGNVLETEIEIKTDELPSGIQEYVTKNYHGKKIKEAAKITDSKGIVTYEAEVKGTDLIFDSKGNFIKEAKD